MPRLLIWTGVLAVLLATFLGYLCHAPHSEEMDQSNRVRVLAAPMKLAHLIVRSSMLSHRSSIFVALRAE